MIEKKSATTITESPPTGSNNRYKEDKKPVTTYSQTQKNFITQESKSSNTSKEPLARAEEILRVVKGVKFTAEDSICSYPERQAFFTIRRMLYQRGKQEIVFAQVNIGEMVKKPEDCPGLDKKTYSAVQCRRVDLLITTRWLKPLLAVEINGSGHSRSETGKINDEIKRIVLESAGIKCIFIEIPDDNSERLKKLITQNLERFFEIEDAGK